MKSKTPNDQRDIVPPVRRPSSDGASFVDVARWRIREWLGRIANRLGIPGAIAETEMIDHTTGQRLSVRVGALFVVVHVNGRDYYFWRFSGRHEGTGTSSGANSPSHYSEA
jgi:hypothetical protein